MGLAARCNVFIALYTTSWLGCKSMCMLQAINYARP